MKKGFTLAEVLITLGIIGIVAAMTMPALIQKQNNTITETRLKKFYSVFNQAILMSVKDNGDYMNWDYWVEDQKDEEGNNINQDAVIRNSFEKYLAPYMKITGTKEVDTGKGEGDKRTLYFLPDGSAFSFARHENRDLAFYPDKAEKCIKRSLAGDRVNGICQFEFVFINRSDWKYNYKKGLDSNLYKWDGQESSLYNASAGCNKGLTGAYCTAIIQRNGWRIPKDYPVKIFY